MKILIVGLGRSGTTFTFRAIRSNPRVKKAFLEYCMLYFFENRKQLEQKYPCYKKGISCCEKINYMTDKLFRNASPHRGTVDITIDEYCEKWLEFFGNEARIIHIIRHPLDGIRSFIVKKGRKMGLYEGDKIELVPEEIQKELINKYLHVCPKYPEKIAKLPQTMTVNYENLISKPDTLYNIYEFCKLPVVPFGEQRRTVRVFGYKDNGFKIEQPIDHIIKIYNKIGGIKYK